MKHPISFKRTLLASAVAVLAFGAMPAIADIPGPAPSACTGVDGTTDCVAVLGHISASVAGTLSINELRGISFGNMYVTCTGADCDGSASLILTGAGVRSVGTTGGDDIVLLNGIDNGGVVDSGAQHPGVYRVTLGNEDGQGAAQGVYISFADNAGNPV